MSLAECSCPTTRSIEAFHNSMSISELIREERKRKEWGQRRREKKRKEWGKRKKEKKRKV